MNTHIISLCTAAAVLAAAGNTLADESTPGATTLAPVTVISAAGYEQKIADAPASITVISREDIDKKPYITLLDAVRDVEGVDIGETTDKTGQGTISIRGMGADYTLILIDGRRQNNIGDLYPNNFGGNQFNHIPPRDQIERIEIIRGPMATLYGSDAIGGVINIITKKIGNTWSGSITQSQTFETDDQYGDDRTTDFSVSGPLIKDRLGINLRGSRYNRDESNPEYDATLDPNGNPIDRTLGFGGGGRTVENENTSLGGRLTLKLDERQDISLDYDTSEQVYDNTPRPDGTYPLGTKDNITSIMRAPGGQVQPRVGYAADQEFTRDQFSFRHQGKWEFANSDFSVSYVETNNNGRTLPFTVNERNQLQALYDGNGGSFTGLEAQIEALFLPRPKRIMETRQTTYDLKFDSVVGDHLLVYGAQYIDAEMEDGVFGMNGADYEKGEVQLHKQWAVFVEDNWDLTDRFTLTTGARYDDHNAFGGNLSPRIYGNWDASPDWTFKGGISTGYKAPKASDLYDGIIGFGGQGTTPFVGSPDLQPEKSINYEIAAYFSHVDGHNFNATLFFNRFKDKITGGGTIDHCAVAAPGEDCVDLDAGWAALGYDEFSQDYNVDRADIHGVELAGRYYILAPLSLRANYTYTDSEIKSGADKGDPLADTAKHMLNASLDWTVTDRLDTYLEAELRSRRYRGSAPRGWDPTLEYPQYWKDYTVFHLGARYEINKHWRVAARINNLFDKDFTGYDTLFTTDDGGVTWNPYYVDDYNLKAKARSFWLSVNATF